MTENDIIQQGEIAKFLVTSVRQGLDLGDIDFYIVIEYGMMGRKVVVQKDDMKQSVSGFLLEVDTSDMTGKVTAKMYYTIPDTDIRGGRVEVDSQVICYVVSVPCPRFISCPTCATTTHDITYTRTEESSIANLYDRLLDVYGRTIKTVDDEYIYVLRSN